MYVAYLIYYRCTAPFQERMHEIHVYEKGALKVWYNNKNKNNNNNLKFKHLMSLILKENHF
jgi:hypothetical protein